jgi:MbtH protein
MSSLLDDPDLDYVVVVNDEQQHSLWPASIAVPRGWTVAHGPAGRDDCLGYVRENWTDIRPASVRAARHGS